MPFFFLKRYNFREVLAFPKSFFHLVRFLMQSFQFVIFILVISLYTSSSHLFLGLPSDLVSAGDHSYTFFTTLLSGIRCTCPNQPIMFVPVTTTTTHKSVPSVKWQPVLFSVNHCILDWCYTQFHLLTCSTQKRVAAFSPDPPSHSSSGIAILTNTADKQWTMEEWVIPIVHYRTKLHKNMENIICWSLILGSCFRIHFWSLTMVLYFVSESLRTA